MADEHSLAVATVLSIQPATATCTVQLTGGKTNNIRSGVKLMAAQSDGLYIVPVLNSDVIVAWTTRNEPYLAMFSDVEDIFIEAVQPVKLQGDQYGGLVKVGEMVTRLNNLENKVNNIISQYNGHVHPNPEGGTVGATTAPVSGTLTLTQVSDVENPRVVHGD